jgi:hypothetical protein
MFMTTQVRLYAAMLLLAAMLLVVSVAGPTRAAGEKDMRPEVAKVADAFKAGKIDDAKAAAAKLSKVKEFEETPDVMHLFRPRKKGGIGWGAQELANPAEDSLEKKLQILAKGPVNAGKEAGPAEEAAYSLAAMAELVKHKPTQKAMANAANKKAWADWSDQMRDASLELAKAAAKKDGPGIGKAAAKVNSSCNNCHSKFKE